MKRINLFSRRFHIRNLKISDVSKKYFQWLKDKDIKRFIGDINYKSVTDLKKYVRKETKKGKYFFRIFNKNTREHVGNIKFYNMNKDISECELGIMIGEKMEK